MNDTQPLSKAPSTGPESRRVRSFLGWAFVISAILHVVTLPFFGIKAIAREHQESEKLSENKIIHVKAPTPPPPTPTPPPPKPQPKTTPPPVRSTSSPPPAHHTIHVVHTRTNNDPHAGHAYVAQRGPDSDGSSSPPVTGSPGPRSSAAVPAPTLAPPTATPKPACANPNADAGIKGQPAELNYSDAARAQGDSGTTQVEVTLDAAGAVTTVTVYKSSGFETLDRAALDAARATAYTPAIVDCVKTAGQYIFRADFDSQ